LVLPWGRHRFHEHGVAIAARHIRVPLAYLPAGTAPGASVSPFFESAQGGWEEKISSPTLRVSDLAASPDRTIPCRSGFSRDAFCGRGFSPDAFRSQATQKQSDPQSRLKPLPQVQLQAFVVRRQPSAGRRGVARDRTVGGAPAPTLSARMRRKGNPTHSRG